MIKYSFIIPMYNSQSTIEKCLDSILNQDTNNYEIIVIDDGSLDNSSIIVRNYACKYDFIKLYIIKHSGVSAARNVGIEASSGKYIIWVDSDDYINKDLLKELEPHTFKDIDIIRYGADIINSSPGRKNHFNVPFEELDMDIMDGIDALEKWNKKGKIFSFLTIYCSKRELYISNNIKFPYGRNYEDFSTMPILIAGAKRVVETSYIGYNYNMRENSITHDESLLESNINDFIFGYDYLLDNIKNYYNNIEKYNNFKKLYFNRLEVKIFNLPHNIRDKYIMELVKRCEYLSINLIKENDNIKLKVIEEIPLKKEYLSDDKMFYIKIIMAYVLDIDGNTINISICDIIKYKSIRSDIFHKYRILSNIDFDKLIEEDYRDFVFHKLLSDTNLLYSGKYNNLYIGNIIESDNEYKINYLNYVSVFARNNYLYID